MDPGVVVNHQTGAWGRQSGPWARSKSRLADAESEPGHTIPAALCEPGPDNCTLVQSRVGMVRLPSMAADLRLEPCRSALNRVTGMSFPWSLNPYMEIGRAHV